MAGNIVLIQKQNMKKSGKLVSGSQQTKSNFIQANSNVAKSLNLGQIDLSDQNIKNP